MPIEERVMASCGACGIRYDVSARTFRDIKAGRVKPRCHLHRRRRRRRVAAATAEMRRFWLDRFTIDEIKEMAEACWPLPSQRGPLRNGRIEAALTAAAEADDSVST